jgi:hypothetical protein
MGISVRAGALETLESPEELRRATRSPYPAALRPVSWYRGAGDPSRQPPFRCAADSDTMAPPAALCLNAPGPGGSGLDAGFSSPGPVLPPCYRTGTHRTTQNSTKGLWVFATMPSSSRASPSACRRWSPPGGRGPPAGRGRGTTRAGARVRIRWLRSGATAHRRTAVVATATARRASSGPLRDLSHGLAGPRLDDGEVFSSRQARLRRPGLAVRSSHSRDPCDAAMIAAARLAVPQIARDEVGLPDARDLGIQRRDRAEEAAGCKPVGWL